MDVQVAGSPVDTDPCRVDPWPGRWTEQTQRNLLRIGVIGAIAAVLIAGLLWWMGWPKIGPSTVTTPGGTVSLRVPAGWSATTPWNAGETATPLVGKDYRVPDIEMEKHQPGPATYLRIYVDPNPDGTALKQLHRDNLAASIYFKKTALSTTSPATGWESLLSTNRFWDNSFELVTVRTTSYVVTIATTSTNGSSLQAANDVISTLKITDLR